MKRFLQKRFLWTLTTLAVVVTLGLPWVVFADNVVNDVVVGGNDTFTLGGSTTVNYKVVATGGDGQSGCNAADGSAATVTIIKPTAVTATPGSLTFTTCGDFKPVVFTASAAGDYSITVSVSDSGPGSYHTTPATFTLHVLPPSGDTTPPVITANVSGTLGNNGWYVSDVAVTWTVSDPESAYTIVEGCVDQTIDYDTTGVTLGCVATSTGGSSSQSVTIKRDATLPTLALAFTPNSPDGSNGWWKTPAGVPFAWTCTDATSGIDPDFGGGCPSPLSGTVTAQGTTNFSDQVQDMAGNLSAAVNRDLKLDNVAPTIEIEAPEDGAKYYLNAAVASDYSCRDATSGVNTCAGPVADGANFSTSPVGSHTFTVSASDIAGNTASLTHNYRVIYNWNGFFRPVDNLPTLNAAKAGSAIPVKFSLSGNQGLGIFAAGYPKSRIIACDTTVPIDGIEETVTAGGSSLSYDPIADQYVYVWKTDKTWIGCRQLVVQLNDGMEYTANFKFK